MMTFFDRELGWFTSSMDDFSDLAGPYLDAAINLHDKVIASGQDYHRRFGIVPELYIGEGVAVLIAKELDAEKPAL